MKIKLTDKMRWFAKDLDTGLIEEFTGNMYWFEECSGLEFRGDKLFTVHGNCEVWVETLDVSDDTPENVC
ncbi:MAG TPA: hypothetical protein V6C95_12100 [Coleofasciculaceae cyanobacterium]